MYWFLCMLRYTKPWLVSAPSFRYTFLPLCLYKPKQQKLKEHPAAFSKNTSVAFRLCSFVIPSWPLCFCITQTVFQSTLFPVWPEVNWKVLYARGLEREKMPALPEQICRNQDHCRALSSQKSHSWGVICNTAACQAFMLLSPHHAQNKLRLNHSTVK